MAIFVLNPYILAVLAQRSLQSAGYDGGVVSTTSATYAARMSLATTEDAADYVAFWQSRIYHSAATSDTRAELFETSARQQVNIEVQNTLDRVSVGGAYYYAGGTNKTFQIRNSAEAGTASIADLALSVLKLETDDVGNVATAVASTLSTTFLTRLTNTITQSGEYYVIGSAELLTDNADAEVNINGVSYGALGDSMGQDATTYSPYFHIVKLLDSTPTHKVSTNALIDDRGRLFTWGPGTNGQLGDGTTVSKSSPVQIGTSSWTSVSGTVGFHAAAIRSDGALFTWGAGSIGRLGDGTTVSKSSPIQIGTSSWSSVSAGSDHTAAIRSDGALFTWGLGTNGRLGDGTTIDKSSPVQIGTSSWSSVSVSNDHTAAIRSDGALFIWGDGTDGALGDGTTVSKSSPVQIGTSSWTSVSVGSLGYTAAIRYDNALFTWGRNNEGQLGSGTTTNRSSPVQVGTSSWTSVSAGFNNNVAIRSDRGLFAWGAGVSGRLGDGTTVSKSSPVQIGTSSWVTTAAGNNVVAIAATGTLFTWGFNQDAGAGSLADGTTVAKSSPVQVRGSETPYNAPGTTALLRYRSNDGTTMSIRGASLVALKADKFTNSYYFEQPTQQTTTSTSFVTLANSAFTVANPGNYHLLLGSGMISGTTVANRTVAELIEENSGLAYNLSHIREPNATTEYYPTIVARVITFPSADINLAWKVRTTSAAHTAQIKNMAAVLLDTGVPGSQTTFVGTASATNSSTLNIPNGTQAGDVVVVASFSDDTTPATPNSIRYATIAATDEAVAYMIDSNNKLYSWGLNSFGFLGDGTTIDKSSPVQIGTSSWVAIGAGIAIRSDGALFTWGYNEIGGIGDGTTISKSSPVQIGTSSWTSVGIDGSGAIRSDGALFMWGAASNGQLGDGTTIRKSSPVQIGTSSWIFLSTDFTNTTAIRNDGALFTWGDNTSGQLGDGTTISKSSPVQIGTNSWIFAATAGSVTAAIRSDGALFTWGNNSAISSGTLGDGTTVSKSSPVQIGTSSWTAVTVAGNAAGSSLAIRSDGALFAWGRAIRGSLGDGTTIQKSSPVQIGTSSWAAVSSKQDFSMALRYDGALFAWGYNGLGNLGNGTTISRSSPVQLGTTLWASGGPAYTAGQSGATAGTVGYNWNYRVMPDPVDDLITDLTLATSAGHIAMAFRNIDTANPLFVTPPAITTGATLMPNPPAINVGPGSIVYRSSPVQVGSANTTLIALGFLDDDLSALECGPPQSFTLVGALDIGAAAAGGTLMAAYRDLETDATIDPTAFDGTGTDDWVGATLALKRSTISANWNDVSAGFRITGAIRSDGALFTWGTGDTGVLGDGTTIAKSSPVQIGTSSWTNITGGQTGFAAILTNGRLFTWGFNNTGHIGDGTTVAKSSPVQIGTSSWSMIAAVGTAFLGILQNGLLYSWGENRPVNNQGGVLGDGTTINKSSPVQIGTSSWSMVAGSVVGRASYAIRSDGALFAWGNNSSGQLGDGTTVDKSSPVQIGTSSWTSITAGVIHAAAIRSDGALFTWGSNSDTLGGYTGQLGDNSGTFNKSSPIQIGSSSWNFINAGEFSTSAIRSDGALFTWGSNSSGDLGDGTTLKRSSPVQIGALSWSKISTARAGITDQFSIGISENKLYVWGANDNGSHGV